MGEPKSDRPARSLRARLALATCIGLALCMLASVVALIGFQHSVENQQAAALGGPFELTRGNGSRISSEDFRGKYMLIYFGYTSCPDVCPSTLADLNIALKDLGKKADEIQPLFVTVDPKRDTPDVVKSFASAFSPRLIGLTGSPPEIAKVEEEFHVYAHVEKTGDGPDDYAVDHSSAFYLMGPDGKFIAVLPADQQGGDLAKLIAHYLT